MDLARPRGGLTARARGPAVLRRHLPFRAVNHSGDPGYDVGLQRHHLLPCQIAANPAFTRMFAEIGGSARRFDDFRANGLLLPCRESTAARLALPLHCGPHPRYSELVRDRVGQIELAWSALRLRDRRAAAGQAQMRLDLLQRALRRFLLDRRRRRLVLNRRDPLGAGIDFAELDALAEAMWPATGPSPLAQPMPALTRSSSLAA